MMLSAVLFSSQPTTVVVQQAGRFPASELITLLVAFIGFLATFLVARYNAKTNAAQTLQLAEKSEAHAREMAQMAADNTLRRMNHSIKEQLYIDMLTLLHEILEFIETMADCNVLPQEAMEQAGRRLDDALEKTNELTAKITLYSCGEVQAYWRGCLSIAADADLMRTNFDELNSLLQAQQLSPEDLQAFCEGCARTHQDVLAARKDLIDAMRADLKVE